MATNLRLHPELAAALRAESDRVGRSQQDVIRDALAEHLYRRPRRRDGQPAGSLIPPRTPYRRVTPTIKVPDGLTSASLLDRDDRL